MTGRTWRCRECDTYNETGASACSVCGSAEPTPGSKPSAKPAPHPVPHKSTPRPSSPSTPSASWALGKVGRAWTCSACGERNSPDDFVCSGCGTVITVDDLLAILRAPHDPRPSTPPKRTTPPRTPRTPSTPTRRTDVTASRPRTTRPTPRPRPTPKPTPPPARSGTDTVLGCVGIVIILALLGALIFGVVALVNFLGSSGDDGNGDSSAASATSAADTDDSGTAPGCPDRVRAMLDSGEAEATSLAGRYRTAEMRITVCGMTASTDEALGDDSGAHGCLIEFDDDRASVTLPAEWVRGAYNCGDSELYPFAVTIYTDVVEVYEDGEVTDEQPLIS